MTVSALQQKSSIAGRSSKNCNLKQANHHYIKRCDLTDGGKKLSLTGKLNLSHQHDQGVTDLSICISLAMCMYINTHTFICESLVKRLSSHVYGKTKLVFWGYNLSVLAEVLTCHQNFKLKLSDLVRSQASRQ